MEDEEAYDEYNPIDSLIGTNVDKCSLELFYKQHNHRERPVNAFCEEAIPLTPRIVVIVALIGILIVNILIKGIIPFLLRPHVDKTDDVLDSAHYPLKPFHSTLQKYPFAIATLCIGEEGFESAVSFFQSVQQVETKADMVALVKDITIKNVQVLMALNVQVIPITDIRIYGPPIWSPDDDSHYEKGNWDNHSLLMLWAWQLTSYQKVMLIDGNIVIQKNVDQLFLTPEFSGIPFTGNNQCHRKGKNEKETAVWSGLEQDTFMILQPSLETYQYLLAALANDSQRDVLHFFFDHFESNSRYFFIPENATFHIHSLQRRNPLWNAKADYFGNRTVDTVALKSH